MQVPLTEKVERLTNELSTKDGMIKKLEQRVDQLEEAADNTEQYSRRPNLRVHGIAEQADENTDQQIVKLVNDEMQFQPPIQLNQIERSHRLWPKTSADGQNRERAIIVRFRRERVRDEVYRSRFKLKTIQPDKRVFINEDLTARRAGLVRQTRALKPLASCRHLHCPPAVVKLQPVKLPACYNIHCLLIQCTWAAQE